MHDLGSAGLIAAVLTGPRSAGPAAACVPSDVGSVAIGDKSTSGSQIATDMRRVVAAGATEPYGVQSIDALSVDGELASRLAGAQPGAAGRAARIHSVYDRTVNVVDGAGFLFCLADASLDDAPRTARVPRALARCGVAVGDAVTIEAGNGGVALVLRPGPRAVTVRLDRAARWRPGIVDFSRQTTDRLRQQSGLLADRLGEPRPRSAFEERSEALLSARLERLDAALETCEASRTASAAMGLIGLGAGLTPSGDDVLVGLNLLAAQDGLLLGAARPGLREAAARATLRTTPISAAMLVEAAEGRARQSVHELLRALSEDPAGAPRLEAVVARVARIGHSSGLDMLRGVRLGLDAEVRLREAAPHDSPILRGPR